MIRKGRMFSTDQDIRARIATNVARLLEVRGMSRRDLAKVTGDPHATIARVACGKHTAYTGVVVRVAEALGVTVDRLLWPESSLNRKNDSTKSPTMARAPRARTRANRG